MNLNDDISSYCKYDVGHRFLGEGTTVQDLWCYYFLTVFPAYKPRLQPGMDEAAFEEAVAFAKSMVPEPEDYDLLAMEEFLKQFGLEPILVGIDSLAYFEEDAVTGIFKDDLKRVIRDAKKLCQRKDAML